jgi:hypothetical protein
MSELIFDYQVVSHINPKRPLRKYEVPVKKACYLEKTKEQLLDDLYKMGPHCLDLINKNKETKQNSNKLHCYESIKIIDPNEKHNCPKL